MYAYVFMYEGIHVFKNVCIYGYIFYVFVKAFIYLCILVYMYILVFINV